MKQSFQPPVSRVWFLERADFALYAAREATAVPIALLALDVGLGAVCHGHSDAAFAAWLAAHRSWPAIALSAVGVAAASLHAVTWFLVSPSLLPSSAGLGLRRAVALGQAGVAALAVVAVIAGLRLLGAP